MNQLRRHAQRARSAKSSSGSSTWSSASSSAFCATGTCCSKACRAWPRRSPSARSPTHHGAVLAPAVHARPAARRRRRHHHLQSARAGLHGQARPDLRQPRPRRRDQPRAGEGAVRRCSKRCRSGRSRIGDKTLHAAGAVSRARDAESDRAGGHLSAARSAGRPLHAQAQVGYPTREDERLIMQRMSRGQAAARRAPWSTATRSRARAPVVAEIYVDEKIEDYILDLVFATREPRRFQLEKLEDAPAIRRQPARDLVAGAGGARARLFAPSRVRHARRRQGDRLRCLAPSHLSDLRGRSRRAHAGVDPRRSARARGSAVMPARRLDRELVQPRAPHRDRHAQGSVGRARRPVSLGIQGARHLVLRGAPVSAGRRGAHHRLERHARAPDEPFIKVFHEERELTVMLVVDVSASSDYGSRGPSKAEVAAELCAQIAFSAIDNGDRVGLVLFSDRVEKIVPPKKGRRHALRIVADVLSSRAGRARHRHRGRPEALMRAQRRAGGRVPLVRLSRRRVRARLARRGAAPRSGSGGGARSARVGRAPLGAVRARRSRDGCALSRRHQRPARAATTIALGGGGARRSGGASFGTCISTRSSCARARTIARRSATFSPRARGGAEREGGARARRAASRSTASAFASARCRAGVPERVSSASPSSKKIIVPHASRRPSLCGVGFARGFLAARRERHARHGRDRLAREASALSARRAPAAALVGRRRRSHGSRRRRRRSPAWRRWRRAESRRSPTFTRRWR